MRFFKLNLSFLKQFCVERELNGVVVGLFVLVGARRGRRSLLLFFFHDRHCEK